MPRLRPKLVKFGLEIEAMQAIFASPEYLTVSDTVIDLAAARPISGTEVVWLWLFVC